MEALICVVLIFLAYFFGRWDGQQKFKKHRVSVIKPAYIPENEIREKLLEAMETHVLIEKLNKVIFEDDFVEHSVEFYTKEKP